MDMSFLPMMNTQAQNQQRQQLSNYDEIWLFAYGSLIFKVDFPFIDQQPASITHWQRRFWQGSHDHRGTLQQPGRVVTLIEAPQQVCKGTAYRVTADVFEQLDYREKNGYLRYEVPLTLQTMQGAVEKVGLVYIADPDNLAFLGEASEADIAQQIAKAKGGSGYNHEYLLELAAALRAIEEHDAHVFLIEKYLIDILNNPPQPNEI